MPQTDQLLIRTEGRDHTFTAGDVVLVGSAAECHVRLGAGPPVLARFRFAAGWVVTHLALPGSLTLDGSRVAERGDALRAPVPSGPWVGIQLRSGSYLAELSVRHPAAGTSGQSTNGQSNNGQASPNRSGDTRLEVRGGAPVMGRAPAPAPTAPDATVADSPTTGRVRLVPGVRTTIGRAGGDADIQIPGADVAVRHAAVRLDGDVVTVRDLGNGTGVFSGGEPVLRSPVRAGETFTVGHFTFRVLAGGEVEFAPVSAAAHLRVVDLSVRYRTQSVNTTERITFDLPQGGMLAIVGPSGMGKSTLCAALLGEAGTPDGRAWLNGEPIANGMPPNPNLVSFVPQRSDAIEDLSVTQNLDYTAQLRLPADLERSARDARVARVVEQLGLRSVARLKVSQLSGGQRRRVAIGMEMLTRPELLMLDEPTSGLDEGLDRKLMRDLRELADGGCTVIVVTHASANLGLASHVLALSGRESAPGEPRSPSTIGYFGPPAGLLDAFGTTSTADVMDGLRQGRHVDDEALTQEAEAPDDGSDRRAGSGRAAKTLSFGRTFGVSLRRELTRLRISWGTLLGLCVLGPLAAGLVSALIGPSGLGGSPTDINRDLGTSLTVVCICLAFLAMALSVTSVGGDFAIIARERRWGMRVSGVILSRAAARLLPAVVQAGVATVILTTLRPVPTEVLDGWPPRLSLFLLLTALTVTAMCIGLLIGTVGGGSDRTAVSVMSAALAAMVILCGTVIPLGDASGFRALMAVLAYATPTRWAVAGVAALIDAEHIGRLPADTIWTHDPTHVVVALLVLALMSALSLLVATLVLPRMIARIR